jgi:hypothetical protein
MHSVPGVGGAGCVSGVTFAAAALDEERRLDAR